MKKGKSEGWKELATETEKGLNYERDGEICSRP
jgi:hypothetical protein